MAKTFMVGGAKVGKRPVAQFWNDPARAAVRIKAM